MSQMTGEFEDVAPHYADLDELLGTQQLWQRDNQLRELYRLYGRNLVDEIFRRSPGLDLNAVGRLLASRLPATHEQWPVNGKRRSVTRR
ncbi:MAG: hypothetical protein PVH25_09230 [Burkholderiales bacterium]